MFNYISSSPLAVRDWLAPVIFVWVVNLIFCGLLHAKGFSEKLRNFVRHNVLESINPIWVAQVTRRVINLHANKIREMAVNGSLK